MTLGLLGIYVLALTPDACVFQECRPTSPRVSGYGCVRSYSVWHQHAAGHRGEGTIWGTSNVHSRHAISCFMSFHEQSQCVCNYSRWWYFFLLLLLTEYWRLFQSGKFNYKGTVDALFTIKKVEGARGEHFVWRHCVVVYTSRVFVLVSSLNMRLWNNDDYC